MPDTTPSPDVAAAAEALGPVRLVPHRAGADEIARASRGRPRPFASADEARYGIHVSLRPNEQDLDDWAMHPDERVALTAVDHIKDRTRLKVERASALVAALLRRADSDGLVWTPALSAARQLGWTGDELAGVPAPTERLAAMGPWLANAPAADVDRLLEVYPETAAEVARSAAHLSYATFESLHSHHLAALASNPHLTPGQTDWLVVRAMQSYAGERVEDALRRRGVAVSERVFQQHIAEAGYTYQAYRAALKLRLTESMLLAMLDDLPSDGMKSIVLTDIASHPDSTPAVWARAFPMLEVESMGAEKAADLLAARDDAPLALLLRHASWQGLALAADRLDATGLEQLRRALLAAPPYNVTFWMKQRAGSIPAPVVDILLEHDNRDVRLLAITTLSPQPLPRLTTARTR